MRTSAAVCRALIVWALLAPAGRAQGPPAPTASAAREAAYQLPLYATRQNVFAIPFTVDRRIVHPVEVQLYVSTDQGSTWQLSARQPPAARQFTFRSRGDGEYWFASRTLDGAQQASSHGPLQTELRVVVDTVPPQLEFAVRTGDGGTVLADWQAADQNLLASSLKIEYQEDAAQPWKPVAITPTREDVARTACQGQTSWDPQTRASAINVRAEVRDRAGNLTVVNRRLLLPLRPASGAYQTGASSAGAAQPFARMGQPSEGAVAWPSDNVMPPLTPPPSAAVPYSQTPPAAAAPSPSGATPPPSQFASTHAKPALDAAGPSNAPAMSTAPTTTPAFDPPPGLPAGPDPVATPTATPSSGDALPAAPSGTGPLPLTSAALPGAAAPGAAAAAILPPGERPQMTNATRFQLAYDVDAVGPDGVAEVQLWATPDGGQTWRMWGTDDDLQSPFDVVVDDQGIFGFHVVVVGRNGLAGRKPRTGDLADIYIGVDTQPPVARLTGAVYGTGAQAGQLLIRWEASDAYLDPRPVTLKFAENPAGPWTVIASALPNTGEFAWPVDAQIPAAVYLQLEVRDEAGNVATDQLTDPVRMDGLAPKARIRGVQPIQDADREAFRQPRRS
ncbi:MAG: hypothetical protein GXY58_02665 [Planctomycetaceae bacterium]|nr:hypothetical protein [Planctomycetaceae bacterium]